MDGEGRPGFGGGRGVSWVEGGGGGVQQHLPACLPERVWVKRSSRGRRILKAESVRNTSG